MKQDIIIPAAAVRDKRLSMTEAVYLCLIAGLGESCSMSNSDFARYFDVKRPAAVEILGKLRKKGFIRSSEKKKGGMVIRRTIEIIDGQARKYLHKDNKLSLPTKQRAKRKRKKHKISYARQESSYGKVIKS